MTAIIDDSVASPASERDFRQEGLTVDETDSAAGTRTFENRGANALAIDQDLPRLLYELAVRLPVQPDIQALCIWLYEPAGQAIRLHVLMADIPAGLRVGMSFPVADSIAGWVWKNQQLLTVNTEAETRFPEFARALLEAGIKSFCGVPLMIANRRIGVLGLASTKPDAFRHFKLQYVQRGLKRTALRGRVIIQFFLAANAGILCAQSNFSTEGVTCRTNRTLVQRGGEWTLLDSEMTMPGGIKVFTNGTFQINDGKARHLQEGQILRPDGNLLNPDGSIMPVFDHIAMSGATVMVFKDGKGQALTDTLILPDGTGINPDGTYARPSGRRSRLVDGQLLTLEGVPMPVLDTISFRSGKVVLYKSGALIPLPSPNVIMGMYDGTRVGGDGFITFPNGTTAQMAEGETITVEGVRADW